MKMILRGDDINSNHGVMMILSGQGVFLPRLSRLRLSTQGLFDSHTQCRALKVIRPAFSFFSDTISRSML